MPDSLTAPTAGRGAAAFAAGLEPDSAPVLDFERLDVYKVAVEFEALASELVSKAQRNLRDQLERASLSILLNTAEGAGRRSRPDKRRFYVMARGSVMECGAIVSVLAARGLADPDSCRRARSLVVRLAQMLTKLEARLR